MGRRFEVARLLVGTLTWLQMRSYCPLKKRDRTPAFRIDRSSFVTPSPSHLQHQSIVAGRGSQGDGGARGSATFRSTAATRREH